MMDFKEVDRALKLMHALLHTSCFTVAVDPKSTEIDQIYMMDGTGGAAVRDFIQALCRWGRDQEDQLLKSKVVYLHLGGQADNRSRPTTHMQAVKANEATARVYKHNAGVSIESCAQEGGQQGHIALKPEIEPMKQLAILSTQESLDGAQASTRLQQWQHQAERKGWTCGEIKSFIAEAAPTTESTVGKPATWQEEMDCLNEVKCWDASQQYLYAVIDASKCSTLQQLHLTHFGDGPDAHTVQEMQNHYCCNDGAQWQNVVWPPLQERIVCGFGTSTIPMRAILEGAKQRAVDQPDKFQPPTEHHGFVLEMVEQRKTLLDTFVCEGYKKPDADQERLLDHLSNHLEFANDQQSGEFAKCSDESAVEREAGVRQHYCGGGTEDEEWKCIRVNIEALVVRGHSEESSLMNDVLGAAQARGERQGIAKANQPSEQHPYVLAMIAKRAGLLEQWQEELASAAAAANAAPQAGKKKRDRTSKGYLQEFKRIAVGQAKWPDFLRRLLSPPMLNRFFRENYNHPAATQDEAEEGTIDHFHQRDRLECAVLEDVCRTLAPIKSFAMTPQEYMSVHKTHKDEMLLQMALLAFHRAGLTTYQVRPFVDSLQRNHSVAVCVSRGANNQQFTMLVHGLHTILKLFGVSMVAGSIVGERAPCHELHHANAGGGFKELTPASCQQLWHDVLSKEVHSTQPEYAWMPVGPEPSCCRLLPLRIQQELVQVAKTKSQNPDRWLQFEEHCETYCKASRYLQKHIFQHSSRRPPRSGHSQIGRLRC